MALPIGGFMPIPLAMMIPFMATQSMVMGDAFGQAFQYGKRKISAMTNEEFNATSINKLAEDMFKAYQLIIPDLKQSIQQSRSLQALIVTELLRLPTSIFQEVTGTSGDAESIRESTPGTSQTGTSIKQDAEGNVTITEPTQPTQHHVDLTEKLPISSTQNPQEQAEKALVTQLKATTNMHKNHLEIHLRNKSANTYSGGQINPAWETQRKKLQSQLTASALNYSKKAQQFKTKWGYWI